MSFANDNFTDTDNTLQENHTPDSGGTWTRGYGYTVENIILSNYLRTQYGNECPYYHSATPPSADYDSVCTCYCGASAATIGGPCIRIDGSSSLTRYGVFYNAGSIYWHMYKYVSGSFTTISTYTGDVPTTTRNVRLYGVGSTIAVDIDSVNRISSTDSSISSANYTGIMGLGTAEQLDTWSSTDLGGGGGRIMGPLAGQGGLAGMGGLAGPGGGLAAAEAYAQRVMARDRHLRMAA